MDKPYIIPYLEIPRVFTIPNHSSPLFHPGSVQ